MKPQFRRIPKRSTVVPESDDHITVRLLLADDPAFSVWSEQRQRDDELHFDAWLASDDGQRWLESETAADEERRCVSQWESW